MSDKCVVRNQAYKRGGLNIRERHNERKNADYMNDDIIPERAIYNVHYKRCEGGYEKAFDRMLADGLISTRGLPKDPHIVDELVFDVNSAYFERGGGYEYAKSFFEEAYRMAVKEIGGEQFVLSAVLHTDERNKALSEEMGRDIFHYHLHVVYVPTVQKEVYFKKNNKNPELAGKLKEVITQVSHSKKWPRFQDEKGWVNSYSLLQDRFFEHMKSAGYTDIERGERGSTAEHLSVLEYKTKKEKERAAAITAEVAKRKKTATAIATEIAQKKQTSAAIDTEVAGKHVAVTALDNTIADKKQAVAKLDKQAAKKQEQLDMLRKKTEVAKVDAATVADIDRMGGKRSMLGLGDKVSLSVDEWKTVAGFAIEGIRLRDINEELRSRLATVRAEVKALKKHLEKYEGNGIADKMSYNQARYRAPKRMAEVIADIMRKPPEQEPAPNRTAVKKKDVSR